MFSCFLSGGHNRGYQNQAETKGLPELLPAQAWHLLHWGHATAARAAESVRAPSPSRGAGRAEEDRRRGPFTGAVGCPWTPCPGVRPGDLSTGTQPCPAHRGPGLPLRRREAAGAGGRDPPRVCRSSGRSRPGRTGPARQVGLRAAKPSPLGSGWAGRAGGPGASPAGSRGTGETFLPGGGEAPAATEASSAGMGPDALQLRTYGGAAAAALLLCAVCVLCRRKRYQGGGARGRRRIPARPRRGSGAARRESRRRAVHWAARPSARPSAPGSPISARRRRHRPAGPGVVGPRGMAAGGPPLRMGRARRPRGPGARRSAGLW